MRRVALVLLVSGCSMAPPARTELQLDPETSGEPVGALPHAELGDRGRVALGEKLFADRTLSADGSVACLDCHPLDRGGTDGKSHSRTVGGRETALNTPTIFNLAYVFRYNWTGAYERLEDEFDAPVKKTMGTDWNHIVDTLKSSDAMRTQFLGVYPDGVTTENVKDALARYIETLTTPDARLDAFLRGDSDALSASERHGYELFKSLGCVGCHQGNAVGGNLFQRFGVMEDYFARRGKPPAEAEQGRYNVTKDPMDRFVFRVPSLRNVGLTGPYFHDGSADTLEQAVTIMARFQLGLTLPDDQIADVAAFLRTLTGEYRGKSQ